ncbi:hypothetical protein CMT41_13005 [Colwellia sp. MT41]|nr:transposase [Colwellia sp. MT41]ALO35530.1 hypothetical protein CMT41_13005 [Colwellia sp. MT41]
MGRRNKAYFPDNIKKGVQYGTNVQAILTYFNQYQLLPYQRTQEMFQDFFNIKLSQGTIKNVLCRGANGLNKFTEQLKESLLASPLTTLMKQAYALIKISIGCMLPLMRN